jgi:hypothetical protein
MTHPNYAMLVDPLSASGKREKKNAAKTLFTRSEERVVERNNDRVSPRNKVF